MHLAAVLLMAGRASREPRPAICTREKSFLTLAVETKQAGLPSGRAVYGGRHGHRLSGPAGTGGRLSLGVVDEAVYQVREDRLPDLFRLLYEHRASRTIARGSSRLGAARRVVSIPARPAVPGYYALSGGGFAAGSATGMPCLRVAGARSILGWFSPLVVRRRFETGAIGWPTWERCRGQGPHHRSNFPDNVTAGVHTPGASRPTPAWATCASRTAALLPLAVDLALPRGFRVGRSNRSAGGRSQQREQGADDPRAPTRTARAAEQAWPQRGLPALGDLRVTIP